MTAVAIVDKSPNSQNYKKYFKFDFDVYNLCSQRLAKILKKDIDINIDLDKYEYVIMVGAEATKYFCKTASVTDNAGHVINGKFIPITNPAVLSFKPEMKDAFDKTIERIHDIVTEGYKVTSEGNWHGIVELEEARRYLMGVLHDESKVVALDTETTSLYPRNGYVLGISICCRKRDAAYILSDIIDQECTALLQKIIDEKTIVFHNAKFDMHMLKYHFGLKFRVASTEDTLAMHYVLDETQGSHGLKSLALKYTDYGDYDKDLEEFKDSYCKAHKMKKEDFNYMFIPFDVMYKYAAADTAVTLELYNMFTPIINKNDKLKSVYRSLMMPGIFAMQAVEDNGIPFSRERLEIADTLLTEDLEKAKESMYAIPELKEFEVINGGPLNPNSPLQLRRLLFDFLSLPTVGKLTGTGALSTDAEVLESLKDKHPIVDSLLAIRQKGKLKNTYVDKLKLAIDRDGRVRTNINLTSTTSGRLSSSGKFNGQNLPRDNPIIKGCIKARPGYKIISQDLSTAEMYYAAALSGDKNLSKVFCTGEDFHSSIAKVVFNLPCEISKVKELYPIERQGSKAVSFGVLYGSGPSKVAETTGISLDDAQQLISDYFARFPKLKNWLDTQKTFIKNNGFIYSAFGRKRRLKNVFSSDKGIAAHEIRSGINFLIQSVASDINLYATIDMLNIIQQYRLDAKIFLLVHDSIVAEVKEEHVDTYCNLLKAATQKDRGVTIPGSPIGVDTDVGDDYSFGKFEKVYGSTEESE